MNVRGLRGIGAALGEALRLAKPYFASEERGIAWGLLAAIAALNLLVVYLNVVYTYWFKVAYDALQTKSAAAFWASMFTYRVVPGFPYVVPGFVENAAVTILASVYAFYLNQMLQIRWRRWLTERFVERWLDRRAYYRISLGAEGTAVDNPDQRIANDLADFTTGTLTLGISLISNFVTIVSFVGVLWTIAPAIRIGPALIPGYLVYAALLYSIVGTGLTQVIGWRLIPLTYEQQRRNADFRFGLVRVRENTEQIALYRGERAEADGLFTRFAAVYENWWRIMKRTKALNFFTISFTQVALIFPLVVAAPGYFSGIFTLGVLMQIVTIFGNVQGALSWFVSSYADLVTWRATVQRLVGFERAVADAQSQADCGELSVTRGGDALRMRDVTIGLPDGRPLLHQARLDIRPDGPIAVGGPSGSGKSTLLRVVAQIWPYARGRVHLPAGELMFLPQRPYFPLGTLKRAVAYPLTEDQLSDAVVVQALEDVGLHDLSARLHDSDNWALRLSGGEQQRLALARALIAAPAWLFLDEALSALDAPGAEALFSQLRLRLPETQIVSVSHDAAVTALHPRRAVVEHSPQGDGTIVWATDGRTDVA